MFNHRRLMTGRVIAAAEMGTLPPWWATPSIRWIGSNGTGLDQLGSSTGDLLLGTSRDLRLPGYLERRTNLTSPVNPPTANEIP